MGFSPFRKEADEARDEQSPIPPDYEHAAASGSAGGAAPEELEGLSLFEKKCVLINKEIDRNGFGRYQWYIWGLCGLGYFIDLIWAQAFGLILSPLQQELGFPGDQSGNISVSHRFLSPVESKDLTSDEGRLFLRSHRRRIRVGIPGRHHRLVL